MRTLEQWVAETPAALRRAAREPARRLKVLAVRIRAEIRQTAPGHLADSVQVEASSDQIEVTSDAPQAAILETGGTIRGRPWLAIPLSGVPWVSGPRSDPARLFVLRSRDGRLFLASHAGGGVQLRWKLQHEVQIRGTRWFSRARDAALEGAAQELLDAVSRTIMGLA